MRPEQQELVALMEQMVELSRGLLVVVKAKCRALAAMKLEAIHEATEQEDALTRRINALHERRLRLLAVLTGQEQAHTAGDVAMDRLIARLEEPERAQLSGLRAELAQVMKDVQFANVTNSIVSRRSLRHFRELVGLLSGGALIDQRYDRSGAMARGVASSGLVNQIA